MDVLKRITYLRELRGWTEYRMAEESGIQQTLISQWYKRELTPSFASIESLCAAFGITLSQFFAEGDSTVDLTSDQSKLLDLWSALGNNTRQGILTLLEHLLMPE